MTGQTKSEKKRIKCHHKLKEGEEKKKIDDSRELLVSVEVREESYIYR
jgi:hypothetical protein